MLAILSVFALVAAACGGDSSEDGGTSGSDGTDQAGGDSSPEPTGAVDTQPETAVGEVQQGGTLRFAVEAETDGLNPTSSAMAVAAVQMSRAVFEPLAAYSEEGELVPYLAESFTAADDLLSWDITVRPGITFHDGEPLNAAAVVANVEGQFADPLVGIALRPLIADPPAEVVDELTARVFLIKPSAVFPTALTAQLGFVASPAWLAAAAEDPSLNQEPVGTGPFRLKERRIDASTTFERNDDWWQTEQLGREIPLDEVEFVIETDSNNRVNLIKAGALEGLNTTVGDSIEELREIDDLYTIDRDLTDESFLMINSAEQAKGADNPFNDIRARRALTLATDREGYQEFFGANDTIRVADQMFVPEDPRHNPDVKQEGNDPDAAAPLVAEFCTDLPQHCTDGKINMQFTYAGPSQVQDDIADLLIRGWEEYFNIQRDQVLQDDYIQAQAIGAFQVVTWRQFGAEEASLDSTWLECGTASGLITLNWPRFCDPERDELLDQTRVLGNEGDELDQKNEIWRELVEKINQDYLYVFFQHTQWNLTFDDSVLNVCSAESPDGVPLRCNTSGVFWVHQVGLAA